MEAGAAEEEEDEADEDEAEADEAEGADEVGVVEEAAAIRRPPPVTER